MATILVFAEVRDGALTRAAREAISVGRSMADAAGGDLEALILGAEGVADGGAAAAAYGADTIRVAESDELSLYQPDLAAQAVADLAGSTEYRVIVFPATSLGKDLAPRVAARLDRPLAPDIVGWRFEGDALVVERPMYAGKAIATLRFTATPALVSVRPNVFPATERAGRGDIERLDAPSGARARVTSIERGERDRKDVAEASIVVSGGRGMGGPENWTLLEELVEALGDEAALGASRAVVDAGWRPHGEQVGQTGKTVAPNLYFAIGISGAIQHLAGMRTARTIVAVNKDAEAPIFGVARYGIVGDVFEILPRLTEEVQALRSADS